VIHGVVEVRVDKKPADNPCLAAAVLRPSPSHHWFDAPPQIRRSQRTTRKDFNRHGCSGTMGKMAHDRGETTCRSMSFSARNVGKALCSALQSVTMSAREQRASSVRSVAARRSYGRCRASRSRPPRRAEERFLLYRCCEGRRNLCPRPEYSHWL